MASRQAGKSKLPKFFLKKKKLLKSGFSSKAMSKAIFPLAENFLKKPSQLFFFTREVNH